MSKYMNYVSLLGKSLLHPFIIGDERDSKIITYTKKNNTMGKFELKNSVLSLKKSASIITLNS